MMTSESYPGIAHGSGVTKLSTGAAAWMPSQNLMTPSGVPEGDGLDDIVTTLSAVRNDAEAQLLVHVCCENRAL